MTKTSALFPAPSLHSHKPCKAREGIFTSLRSQISCRIEELAVLITAAETFSRCRLRDHALYSSWQNRMNFLALLAQLKAMSGIGQPLLLLTALFTPPYGNYFFLSHLRSPPSVLLLRFSLTQRTSTTHTAHCILPLLDPPYLCPLLLLSRSSRPA